MRLVLAATAAIVLSSPTHALTVEQGQAAPRIVIGGQASVVERFAAEELRDYINAICGVALPIAARQADEAAVVVGKAADWQQVAPEVVQLADDGFVLRSAGERLYIVGSNDRGTLYGVYSLLEDHLGCRWVQPGTQGEIIPKADRLDFSGIDDVQVPDLTHRALKIHADPDQWQPRLLEYIDWQAKQRINYLYWQGSKEAMNDTTRPVARFHDEDLGLLEFVQKRGFIVDVSGHSFKQFGGNVDIVGKGSEDDVVVRINQFLDENPFIDIVGLWTSDGWDGQIRDAATPGPLDLPERYVTRQVDFKGGGRKLCRTNSYVDFVNRVAARVRERHPAKLVSMLAYNATLLDPEGLRCTQGQPVHIAFRRCYVHGFGDADCRTNRPQQDILERWLQASPHVVLYEYYWTSNLFAFPRVFPRTIAEDLKYLHQVGAAGTASQSCAELWPALGVNFYTYAKMSWDCDREIQAVLDDYCRHAYGAAAEHALSIFDTLEQTFAKGGEYFRYDWGRILPLFTGEVRGELLKWADQAVLAAQGESEAVRYRVEQLRLAMQYTDLYVRAARHREPGAAQAIVDLVAEHGERLMGRTDLTQQELRAIRYREPAEDAP